jgi:hypothetical protein
MARIPDDQIERLKQGVSQERARWKRRASS